MKQNPHAYKNSLEIIEAQSKANNKDTIAWVNDIPITTEEFNLRKGLKILAEEKDTSDNGIFNILVEEKLEFAEAAKRGLLPTEQDVQIALERERQNYREIPEYKNIVDSLCMQSNMSLEEYWTVYERYNEYRILVFSKLYNNEIDTAQQNGILAKNSSAEGLSLTEIKERTAYWKNVKLNMKNDANIRFNETLMNYSLKVDHSKLYTIK